LNMKLLSFEPPNIVVLFNLKHQLNPQQCNCFFKVKK